jgi:hypothetical protein
MGIPVPKKLTPSSMSSIEMLPPSVLAINMVSGKVPKPYPNSILK